MKDAQFLADAKKSRLTVDYLPASEVERIVNNVFATPPEPIATAKVLLS